MFGNDRTQLRQLFFSAWDKHLNNQPTEPLEQVIIQVISLHPEYHKLLENEAGNLEKDYLPESGETNPFLHMAMHISIQEQLATQRPLGIEKLYKNLLNKYPDPHEVEHQMMECLAEMIWQSQRSGAQPDENAYIECLKQRSRQ